MKRSKVPMKPVIFRLLGLLMGCCTFSFAAKAEAGHIVSVDTIPPPKKVPSKTTEPPEKKTLPVKPDVIKQVPKSRKQVKPIALPKVKPKVIKPKVIKGVTGILP